MNRKTFSAPIVTVNAGGPGGNPGSGNGQLGLKPIPMSYDEWLQTRWVGEFDENPGIDFEDYAKWFASTDFGTAAWDSFNPGVVNENDK